MHGMILQFAVIFACNLLVIMGQARLSIINESRFPHSPDTKFQFQVVPINQMERIDQFLTNTMILQIKDKHGKEKGKYIFDYGRKYKIDEIIDNNFFMIEEWTKNEDSTLMQISIWFKRISNGHIIQIFDLQARLAETRKAMINNLTLATLLYNETIELESPSKLQLTVNSIGGDNVVLKIGQLAVAKCKSYDGIPLETARFTNLQYFDVVNKTFVKENNEIKIMLRVRLSDHMKPLNCSAGRANIFMLIRVLHPTTTIAIEPPINKTLEVNSTISCYSKDGYPPAQTQWNLINGPENASSFYEVTNKWKTIHIKADAPTETLWQFYCSVKEQGMINKTVSFITTDKYCDNVCLKGQIKIQNSQILQISNQINKSMETLRENQIKQDERTKKHGDEILMIKDQINKSMELLKESSRNELKILQESIGNIAKKFDSVIHKNKQQMDETKSNLRRNLIGVPDLIWKIGGISAEMNKGGYLDKYFYPGQKEYEIWLTIKFHPNKLEVHLWSYQNNQSEDIYPLHLQATISVINTASARYYKTIAKSFVLGALYAGSPYFIFTKEELADVIKDDSITINCFIKFK